MGGVNPWFILIVAAAAVLYLKGSSLLTRTAALSAKPASGSPIAKPPSASIDQYSADDLGMAYARAKKREAEDEVSKIIVDRAGKTIKDAFTAPFSVADPGNPS